MRDEQRKRVRLNRKGPAQRAARPTKAQQVADIWPLGEIPYALELMEMSFRPEKIDQRQIYETLVAGPKALDEIWRMVLTGYVPAVL